MALSCQACKTTAKYRFPTTCVIISPYQMKGLSFRRSELSFWFLLCSSLCLASVFLSCGRDGRSFAVIISNFPAEKEKNLCPDQVSKSCIFNPNGDKSSMSVSKIWLPSNRLQSERRRWEKCSLGSQINQDEKIDKKRGLLFGEMIRPSSLVSWT